MEFNIMKLFEDKDYVSPGSIGGKIKRIRELRGYTQKQLGIACGFSQTSADVRIAQYEKNKKIPREKVLNDIASALGIDDCALYDADMLSYNRMYHALFDMEDFHALHPVKKNDGYYLEFGGRTILGQDIYKHDFDKFCEQWYNMYQKSLPTSTDTHEEKERKATEYALWRYEYPKNTAKETAKEIHNRMKMNRLQAQLDLLNAEMQADNEIAKLDSSMGKTLEDTRKNYKSITKESEFILFIKDMLEAGIQIEHFSPEEQIKTDYEHIHVVSFRTDDIINNNNIKKLFATFLCQIETMQKAGIQIDRKITSKNKELYVTYEIVTSQRKYVENLIKYWDDIIFIVDRHDTWSDKEIKKLNDKLISNITGENDVILQP